jgi:hypothetical protein
MATERQILANRQNASNSTGPRSKAGKDRASHNSTRHGLSRAAVFSASDREWIERFALDAARGNQSALALELARSAAVFHLDLARIRNVRAKITEDLRTDLDRLKSENFSGLSQPLAEYPEHLVQLKRIDRYERRAASRRDKALRAIFAINKAR